MTINELNQKKKKKKATITRSITTVQQEQAVFGQRSA